MNHTPRTVCYHCYRPTTSCMCKYITPIETKTRFVILMHPKEFRKTKNGTGHFTHLSLKNCDLFVGINFSAHQEINELIDTKDTDCFVLYPSENSINLNVQYIGSPNKDRVLFIMDATWPCSRAMLKASPNLNTLPKVSFTHTKSSGFIFKEQPKDYCLSTMESTLCVLELLHYHQLETLDENTLKHFLKPFEAMVKYQITYA